MTRNRFDCMSGEWLGEAEDYHEALPAHDRHWGFAIVALVVFTWACAMIAIIYAVGMGLPSW